MTSKDTPQHVQTEVTYIPVKNLSVIWVASQRPYNEAWAKKIADNFDIAMFDPLIVTQPNGEGVYHIIEGQHRRHALEMWSAAKFDPTLAGNEQAPCRIIEDVDPARAADIWLGINRGRKAITQVFAFQVAVTAKHDTEVQINDVVIKNGYHISPAKNPNGISAVAALKDVYNRFNRLILNQTLRTLRLIWGSDPAAVKGPMIKGMAIFINEFGSHIDFKRLQIRMQRLSPHKVMEAAKKNREAVQERLEVEIAEMFRREHNYGLKSDDSRLKRKER